MVIRPPTQIELPHEWSPRAYQLPLWQYMEEGGTRAVAVWHRRAGKDSESINFTSCAAHVRVGTYWHMLPTAIQGRRVVWDGIGRDGVKFIDQAFPPSLRKSVNNTEMKIELKCGSIWQVVGSDNYNSLVGSNPVGVIMSEYSIADPEAWNYIRPILAENGGWIIFIYTARGPNHGKTLADMAKNNPKWFYEKLTVDDTDVVGPEIIQEERDSGMPEEMIQQEYYCSFDAPLVGAYYGKVMSDMEKMKPSRIDRIPYDPGHTVQTWWDFGINDMNSIVFTQYIAREWRIIDYIEDSNKGIAEYAQALRDKGYSYDFHGGPHDVEERSLQTGTDLKTTAAGFGIDFTTIPRTKDLIHAIQKTRKNIKKVWIDNQNAARVIDCLRNYQRAWDEKNKVFLNKPLHNWASHGADAIRTWSDGAEFYSHGRLDHVRMPVVAESRYDPLEDEYLGHPTDADADYNELEYLH